MDTNPSLYQAVRMVRKSLAMQGIRIPRIGRVLVLLSFGEGYSQAVLGLVDLLLMGGTPDPSICSSARAENLQVNWKQFFRLGTPPHPPRLFHFEKGGELLLIFVIKTLVCLFC